MKAVIIGAVAAGMSTAAKLKRNLKENVDIHVFEKGDEISYGACGLPFYISDTIKEEKDLFAKSVDDFIQSGINLHVFHEVISVDTDKKLVKVRDIKQNREFEESYDVLVIGSGTRPKKVKPLDMPAKNNLSVHSVYESGRIKEYLATESVKNVVIVGAGFVGLEMLEACAAYGKNITLLQGTSRIFEVMDEDITDKMEGIIQAHHITIHKNVTVTSLHLENELVDGIEFAVDGESLTLPCDLLICSIGTITNTEFITSVDKAQNGAIIVDEHMMSSVQDVYAAGDCSIMRSGITGELTYAPLGTNANKQGRIIADVLAGIKPKPFKLIHSTALKLFDYDIAKVGISKAEGIKAGMDVEEHKITANSYASYYSSEKLDIKVIYNKKTRVIVGAQLIGQGTVVPRANYYAIAIYAGLTVDEMGMMDLAYSPPYNGVWDAALIASNTIK
jgi:NADPH-dependent 2,4-dienoyl-CoA reductase/sulfur reductase-like enzyme